MLASMARRGFTAPDGPESPRYYAPSPYGLGPHHLGVFVTLRAGMISLQERCMRFDSRMSRQGIQMLHVLVRAPA